MASHIVGYPRMGPKRELKFALESFWDGKSSAEDLQKELYDVKTWNNYYGIQKQALTVLGHMSDAVRLFK